MVSHHPEVARLLHSEHVRRLAEDARLPLLRLPAPRPWRVLSRPAVVAHSAAAARRQARA